MYCPSTQNRSGHSHGPMCEPLALPHVAKDLRRGNRVDVRPMEPVLRLVDEDLAAVRAGPRAEHHVIAPVLFPHLRVAYMAGHIARIIFIFHQKLLAVNPHAVARDGEAEVVPAPRGDVVVVARVLDVAGVVQIQCVVLHQRGAGIDAVDVPRLVGAHGDRLLRPVQQIGAAPVSPELDAAVGVKRAVLIEHMVAAAVPAQAVRVVHPAGGRHEMKAQAARVGVHPCPVLRFDAGDQAGQISMQCIHREQTPFPI